MWFVCQGPGLDSTNRLCATFTTWTMSATSGSVTLASETIALKLSAARTRTTPVSTQHHAAQLVGVPLSLEVSLPQHRCRNLEHAHVSGERGGVVM